MSKQKRKTLKRYIANRAKHPVKLNTTPSISKKFNPAQIGTKKLRRIASVKKEKKKILKAKRILTLATILQLGLWITCMTFNGVSIGFSIKRMTMLNSDEYKAFNEKQKLVQIEERLDAGEFSTTSELSKAMSKIDDYDKKQYFEESASEKQLTTFKNSEKVSLIGSTVGSTSLLYASTLSIINPIYEKRIRKREREVEELAKKCDYVEK